MYTINNQMILDRLENYYALWGMWIEAVSTGDVVDFDRIQSVSTELQSTSKSSDIELGAICSQLLHAVIVDDGTTYLGNQYEFDLFMSDSSSSGITYGDLKAYTYGELKKLTIKQISDLGKIIGDEKIPLGTFSCVKSKRNGINMELEFADALYFSDREYIPRVRFPATGQAIEDDICSQLGIENGNDYTAEPYLYDIEGRPLYDDRGRRLRSSGFDFEVRSKGRIPKGTTMRQMLGYIASAHGQFGFIDRFGRYVRKWYGQSVKTLDNNTIDLPTISEQQNVITGIVCTVSDDLTLKLGDDSGRVLQFENPFMTTSLLASIWFRVQGYSWYTVDLYHRLGDPRFDIGDVITYDDGSKAYEIPITTLDYSFDGGLSANIAAVGLNVEEQTI